MTDAEDSGTQETAEESESAADESPERSERSYRNTSISEDADYESCEAQKEVSYRNSSKKTVTKKTLRMGSLEKAVSESNARTEVNNISYTSQNLVLSLAERVEAAHSADSDEDNDKEKSAVAIVFYRDKKTGELELLFEQKPLDYRVPEAGGKLSLIGGGIQKGESSIEALVRELAEEIEEPAASIVIKSLDKYSFYQKLAFEYKGARGYTDIYVIEIRQEASWSVVKQAVFKHDAGSPRVLKQNEVRVGDFAFGYGEIAKKFVDDNSKLWNKTSDSLHVGSHYLAQSPLPSFGLSNIASLSPVQPYNAGMLCSQNRLAA